ncbi:LON peptidase substrate-binding domain-containing protein [Kangiella koreensis]|uniref:Peptidase S16 lon domain protein n=1 Tax=Kangiella koreensis (strain DSM 16069 / JCM 12317 / KCTC 12182 / SW-125) TaxID=523791 RepID=C7R9D5_KANKD|nr:LON peptidase substrate-binding domain-containing protein [Kangiella koreensis]ACV26026.1 peptidase S16 lon domain protein [Kangiella koreensis DSM 16069]
MPKSEANQVIPIFPLQRVVFPDSVLRLQIFEQRYLDMIAKQLSQQQGFGVTLIKKGNEAGIPATPFEFGTYVEIVDFDQKDNGLLLITCVGQKRFRINSQTVMPDKLITANVSWLDPLKQRAMTDDQSELLHLLSDLSKHPQVDILDVPERWTELGFVLERLTEYMPITEKQKQAVLEESDLDTRIAMLYQMLGWLS